METPIIGAEIVATDGKEGVIVDKAHGECVGASPTIYICMDKEGKVFTLWYSKIKEIKGFITHPNSDFSHYIKKYKENK